MFVLRYHTYFHSTYTDTSLSHSQIYVPCLHLDCESDKVVITKLKKKQTCNLVLRTQSEK